MFEIGFPELVLIAIVGLLVIGPERLPEALRTMGLWLGRMRRSFTTVKAEIEKEIGMDEVKRQLHNEAIMEEMKRIEAEVKQTASAARSSIDEGALAAEAALSDVPEMPRIDPDTQTDIASAIAAQDSLGSRGPDQTGQSGRDGSEPADPRDHSDAGADSRDPGDAATDHRDHADAADPAEAPTEPEVRRG